LAGSRKQKNKKESAGTCALFFISIRASLQLFKRPNQRNPFIRAICVQIITPTGKPVGEQLKTQAVSGFIGTKAVYGFDGRSHGFQTGPVVLRPLLMDRTSFKAREATPPFLILLSLYFDLQIK
jgi:hypothetical protein